MSTSFKKFLSFYLRFAPSYTGIGYVLRGIPLKPVKEGFAGQTWLVAGGSAGIGGSAVVTAANKGAVVYATARGEDQLRELASKVTGSGRIVPLAADLSRQSEVLRVVSLLKEKGETINTLVNNVGIMTHHITTTEDGLESSYAVSLQNHYLLVKFLMENGLLSNDAVVVEVSSGGMYNHPLVLDEMNNLEGPFEAKRNYGLNKRAQVVLTGYWRKKYASTNMQFYAMHPGWCDTAPVRRDMPTFHRNLKYVLRSSEAGADTIIWLAANRPQQKSNVAIWFDRKERPAHMYERTKVSKYTDEDLVGLLESNIKVPAAAQ